MEAHEYALGADTLRRMEGTMRLAVAVVLTDEHGRVLLTRRRAHMRTFPRAWVLPGGGVDPGESLRAAAARELAEESGIRVPAADMRAVALWESVYPTTAARCIQRGGIAAHHLLCFFTATVDAARAQGELSLQEEETDRAVWAGPQAVAAMLAAEPVPESGAHQALGARTTSGATTSVALRSLCGIYPTAGSGADGGTAQAHLFCLAEMLSRGAGGSVSGGGAARL